MPTKALSACQGGYWGNVAAVIIMSSDHGLAVRRKRDAVGAEFELAHLSGLAFGEVPKRNNARIAAGCQELAVAREGDAVKVIRRGSHFLDFGACRRVPEM